MATPNIVPRASGEGGLGTSAKGWGGAFVTNTTTSSATQGGKLVLQADDGAVMASGHRLGVIEFAGAEDTSNTITVGARIEALCDATWSASENGADLVFYTTDGNASQSESMRIFSDLTGGVQIKNTTASSAVEGAKLVLAADDGAVMGDNHRLGVIEFKGAEDTSNTLGIGARIQAIARDAWDASNNDADLEFYTADGATNNKVLTLDADKKATLEGAIAVKGDVDLGGTANYAKTISFGAGYHLLVAEVGLVEANETDNGVIIELPGVKLPQYAHVLEASLTITELSNLGTYNINVLIGTNTGVAADAVPANPHEIIGAGSGQSYWTDDVDGVTDVIMGSGTGNLKKSHWNNRSEYVVSINADGELTADHYVYICNGGTGNGTSNATAGKVYISIRYFGAD